MTEHRESLDAAGRVESALEMGEAPDPRTRGLPHVRTAGELNRETTTLDHARIATPSVEPGSPCFRVPSRYLGSVHPRGAPASVKLIRPRRRVHP
jgi:hypothetical protein